MVPSGWFRAVNNSYEGFEKFLDELGGRSDVFLVSQQQVIEWMKNPVPASQFKTDVYERTAECDSPVNCALENSDGNIRYMKSCIPCPEAYPWLGNPTGELNPTTTSSGSTTTTTPGSTTTPGTTTTETTTTETTEATTTAPPEAA
jgi:hypothetical protein